MEDFAAFNITMGFVERIDWEKQMFDGPWLEKQIESLLTTQKTTLIKKVEGLRLMKDAMQGDIPSAYKSYNQALTDVLEALTNE